MAQNSVNLDSLLGQVPIADIATQFGVDERTAKAAVSQALPGLLGGMAVNASVSEGEAALSSALKKHQGAKSLKLEAIDTADGKKIVKHVLGDKEESMAQALSSGAGDSGIAALIPKLLPILAPIVMQFLAGKVFGDSTGGAAQQKTQESEGGLGGVLGDLLGGVLGGGSSNSSGGSGGSGGLGDILGSVLGGGSQKGGGGLGDLLGGLLGGK